MLQAMLYLAQIRRVALTMSSRFWFFSNRLKARGEGEKNGEQIGHVSYVLGLKFHSDWNKGMF